MKLTDRHPDLRVQPLEPLLLLLFLLFASAVADPSSLLKLRDVPGPACRRGPHARPDKILEAVFHVSQIINSRQYAERAEL